MRVTGAAGASTKAKSILSGETPVVPKLSTQEAMPKTRWRRRYLPSFSRTLIPLRSGVHVSLENCFSKFWTPSSDGKVKRSVFPDVRGRKTLFPSEVIRGTSDPPWGMTRSFFIVAMMKPSDCCRAIFTKENFAKNLADKVAPHN